MEQIKAGPPLSELYPDAAHGDVYLNPFFGDLWIVDGPSRRFLKINDGYPIDMDEPDGFIKVGHLDDIANKLPDIQPQKLELPLFQVKICRAGTIGVHAEDEAQAVRIAREVPHWEVGWEPGGYAHIETIKRLEGENDDDQA